MTTTATTTTSTPARVLTAREIYDETRAIPGCPAIEMGTRRIEFRARDVQGRAEVYIFFVRFSRDPRWQHDPLMTYCHVSDHGLERLASQAVTLLVARPDDEVGATRAMQRVTRHVNANLPRVEIGLKRNEVPT